MRLVMLLMVFTIVTSSRGQLHPVSNQYVHNAFAINPAEAGKDGALSMSLLYKNQWVGFEGSPKTLTAALHAPFNKNKVGLGMLIFSDSYGITNSTTFRGNYSYRMELGRGMLAFGLSFSATTMSFSVNKIVANDVNDDFMSGYPESTTKPNFGTGIYYSAKNYFVGLSVPKLLSHSWDGGAKKYTLDNDNLSYNYFCYGGCQIKLNRHIKLAPSALMKYFYGSDLQFDITPQIIIMNRIWLGSNLSTDGLHSGMLRCNIDDQISFAYAYGFETGNQQKYVGASHEVMLKYVLKYNSKVVSPR